MVIRLAVQIELSFDEPVYQERRATRFRACPRCGRFIGLTVTRCGWCGKRLRRQAVADRKGVRA